jgi:hypothetical protein
LALGFFPSTPASATLLLTPSSLIETQVGTLWAGYGSQPVEKGGIKGNEYVYYGIEGKPVNKLDTEYNVIQFPGFTPAGGDQFMYQNPFFSG